MSKRNCILIGFHLLALSGITAGYVCMYKKMNEKKPKLNFDSLDLD